ncbi:Uma2 family endonuclease [Larkinella sp. VNQ87]|uniref:Uma2 family endonuclease n=1 Tax=Larkinella sp. VNQ87 TaxID=3400921 RepID=UPI003BFC2BF6
MIRSKKYTYADYLTWQLVEGRSDVSVELIKGKVARMSPAPKRIHQAISFNLSRILGQQLKGKSCRAYAAPFDVRLATLDVVTNESIETVVQPDLSVICDPAKLDDQGCMGAPDWIIEILSPGSLARDTKEKFDLYEENGVKEYWQGRPRGCGTRREKHLGLV